MSLALVALRLQAVAALASHPVIAALCDGRIYDSRIDDFDSDEPAPTIVVSTEEASGAAWNPQNGGAPFDDRCRLTLDIAMTANAHAVDDDGHELPEVIGTWSVATDAELEAQLNLIAWCAEQVLTLGVTHPLGPSTPEGRLLRAAVTRRVTQRSIERFARDVPGRLANHLVTFEVELKGEDWDAANPPIGPFAALPDPLRTVCAAAGPGSPAAETCARIAGLVTLPELRPLAGARFGTIAGAAVLPGAIPIDADFDIPT